MNELEQAKAAFGAGVDEDEIAPVGQVQEIGPARIEPPPVDVAKTGDEVISRTRGRLIREREALLRPANQVSIRNEPPIERKLREARAAGLGRAVDILAQEMAGQGPRS